ncbi:MAG TPA: SGNH/GDSL hydrolase family protein [bacterium]|nr:SGNH/GDSL hydrolase family protein [bacterium]
MKSLILQESFETDPTERGWHATGADGHQPAWLKNQGLSASACLSIPAGHWDSPAFSVKPFSCYQVRYWLKCGRNSYAAAIFYDRDGRELPSDHYTGADPSATWQERKLCFLAKAEASQAKVRFRCLSEPLLVDEVEISQVAEAQVLTWLDDIYSTMPALACRVPAEGVKPLAHFLKKLKGTGRLRIVLVGDSVVNDISNSFFHLLLQRHFPQIRIEVVSATKSGGNCAYYGQDQPLSQHILLFQPDLVMVGGISHGGNTEAIRQLVEKVTQVSQADILLLTGAFITPERQRGSDYPERLRLLASQLGTGFLDTETIWSEYVALSGHPADWFLRDSHHANERGKQVIARLLEKFFCAGVRS